MWRNCERFDFSAYQHYMYLLTPVAWTQLRCCVSSLRAGGGIVYDSTHPRRPWRRSRGSSQWHALHYMQVWVWLGFCFIWAHLIYHSSRLWFFFNIYFNWLWEDNLIAENWVFPILYSWFNGNFHGLLLLHLNQIKQHGCSHIISHIPVLEHHWL